MNPAQLLNYFDRISDAPDAIPRLRRFILDLAVRGKLVEQDARDEIASELLDLVRTGVTNFAQDHTRWITGEFEHFLEMKYGKGLPASDRTERGDVPVFGSNGVVSCTHTSLTDKPSIIVGRKGSAGALNVCDGPSWTTDVAYFLESPAFFHIRYLFFMLSTLDLGLLGKGVKPGLSRSDVYPLVIAVPPLAEQRRIVAKADELMALCDRLEVAQAEREQRRDRLTAASLRRLNDPVDAAAFREDAAFHLRHLARCTSQPDQVSPLRQTILNLAVFGKLVAQDSRDDSTAELLEQIQADKTQLLKKGVKARAVSPADRVISAQVPRGWQAVRASELLTFVTSGSRGWAAHYATEGSMFLRIGNLDYGTTDLDLSDVQHVNPPNGAEGERTLVQEGDILISITGDTGMVGLVPAGLPPAYINQHIALARPSNRLCNRYLAMYFTSPPALADLKKSQRGIKNSLGLEDIRNVVVLVPPVAEQHRIVAKVEELMGLCDRLEAQLTSAQTESRRLLEAVLHEALAPAV